MFRNINGRCKPSVRSILCLNLAMLGFILITTTDKKHETEPVRPRSSVPDDVMTTLLLLHERTLKGLPRTSTRGAVVTQSCTNEPHFDRACVDTNCPFPFPGPGQNVRQLAKHKYQIPEVYRKVVARMGSRAADSASVAFVTASSANHYRELQALVKNLMDVVVPVYGKLALFVYDIGLHSNQSQAIRKHCKICVLKNFPFHDLPPVFRNLRSYTWKPIIIQAHLQLSDVVLWMDSSVRFVTGNLSRVLDRVRTSGVLACRSHVSTALRTSKRTFSYFGHHPCQFSRFTELEATFLIFHRSPLIQQVIVDPWVACAFSPACMFPPGTDKTHYDCRMKKRTYGYCHRFDQSALTVILAKVFGEKLDHIVLRHGEINVNKRGNGLHLFPERDVAS